MDLKRINEEIECEFQDIFYYYKKYNYGICPTAPMMCFFLRENKENGDIEVCRIIKGCNEEIDPSKNWRDYIDEYDYITLWKRYNFDLTSWENELGANLNMLKKYPNILRISNQGGLSGATYFYNIETKELILGGVS